MEITSNIYIHIYIYIYIYSGQQRKHARGRAVAKSGNRVCSTWPWGFEHVSPRHTRLAEHLTSNRHT